MSETTGGESTEGSGSVLVEASVETVPSAATAEDAAVAVAAPIDSGTLALQDVLQGLHSDAGALGVYLRLESVGNDTIVSVDPGAFTVSVPIATIDNVIGVTLQQLLNNDLITKQATFARVGRKPRPLLFDRDPPGPHAAPEVLFHVL